ncbi:MAG: glycosyltransferase family 2 protein [Clostridia bacterium]|nr:glycosyltransferase family 2 protein [Clostridia bacterium]
MDNPKVSIIVPVYNAEKTLDRCVNSILSSSYANIELVLVNDGSKDNSLSICNEFSKIDNRVIIVNQQNMGVSCARNNGILASSGEFITFVDADDYISKELIDKLLNKLIEYGVDLVISNAIDFDSNNQMIESFPLVKSDIFISKEDITKEILHGRFFPSTIWGNLYKACFCKKISFNSKMRIAEDFNYLMDYKEFVTNGALVIPYRGYYYFNDLKSSSVTKTGFNEKWNDEFHYCKGLIKNYEGTKYEQYAIARYLIPHYNCAMRFSLDKEHLLLIKNNIKPYVFRMLLYKPNVLSYRKRIKILFIYLFNLIIVKKGSFYFLINGKKYGTIKDN